jgi:hypothetical protein
VLDVRLCQTAVSAVAQAMGVDRFRNSGLAACPDGIAPLTSPEVRKWYVPWYFLTPPIGAILALGFYLVVRGGFFAAPTSAENVNVFAFGGTGVLVGLFAEVATDRLEGAFGSAFPAGDRQRRESSDRDESSETR